MKVKVKVPQWCPALCNPVNYTVHGILQARILACIAIPFSRGSSQPRGIMQMTEKLSRGDVTIGSGTMYGATSNMMKKGWIKEIMSTEGAERRRLYQLTDMGREALRAEISRLRRMLENAEEV